MFEPLKDQTLIAKMKSAKLGKRSWEVEVTNVSFHGLWLLTGDTERFLSYKNFPWFRDAQ